MVQAPTGGALVRMLAQVLLDLDALEVRLRRLRQVIDLEKAQAMRRLNHPRDRLCLNPGCSIHIRSRSSRISTELSRAMSGRREGSCAIKRQWRSFNGWGLP